MKSGTLTTSIGGTVGAASLVQAQDGFARTALGITTPLSSVSCYEEWAVVVPHRPGLALLRPASLPEQVIVPG